MWSNNEWYAARPDRHRLFRIMGIGVTHVQYDWMHCKHLGTDKVVFASVLHILVFEVMGGDDPAANVDTLWGRIDKWYSDNKIDHEVRYRMLKLSMICNVRAPFAKQPKLRGNAIQVRNLMRPLADIWSHYMDPASDAHKQIALLLKSSIRLEEMLDVHKHLYVFPPAIAHEFQQTTERYLVLACAINHHYHVVNARLLFTIIPKFHMLWHAAYNSRYISPRMTWCYKGEDQMQHCRRMAARLVASIPAWRVGEKLLYRWMRGFTFRFMNRTD